MKFFFLFFTTAICFIGANSLNSQEVNFFGDISCEPIKKEVGNSIKINFSKSMPEVKFYEYEKGKEKTEKVDLFPNKTLEAHIFLSRNFCQFHVISRRPSVNSFHFVMNLDAIKSEDLDNYQGAAHFNFHIDEVSPTEKDHKLVNCSIDSLKIPGYYYHSCKKKKSLKTSKKKLSPARTEPKYEYYQENNNYNNQNGSSSYK
jgi:hypothetical protein